MAFKQFDRYLPSALEPLSGILATGTPGEITTAPMERLPLLLIPVFLVPLFLMLRTAALMQSRQTIRSRA